MVDFSDLAAIVAAKRTLLLEREALERDRRSGLLALRPAIDQLEATVRPTLEAAKAALLPAGIRLEIEDGWTDPRDKQASLTVFGSAAGSWSSYALHARSGRFTIAVGAGARTLERRTTGSPDHPPERIELPIGTDVAVEAVTRLIDDLLAAAEGQPVLRGADLRTGGRAIGNAGA